jgi:hypothetical protein
MNMEMTYEQVGNKPRLLLKIRWLPVGGFLISFA